VPNKKQQADTIRLSVVWVPRHSHDSNSRFERLWRRDCAGGAIAERSASLPPDRWSMDIDIGPLLFGAGVAGGVANAMARGATLITFAAVIVILSPCSLPRPCAAL
jgi:hypothetical protein